MQALLLERGKADEGHQGVAVQAAPRTTLEVVEPEFFFELLVHLLARPAGLIAVARVLSDVFAG